MGFKSFPDDEFDAKTLIAVDSEGVTVQDENLTAITTVTSDGLGIGTETPSRPLSIETAENEAIRLDNTQSGGDCSINFRTSYDTDVNYAIGIDGSDDSFRISKSANVGTDDRIVISSTGNVGLGKSDPNRPLDVVGSENELMRLDNTQSGGDCAINLRTSYDTDVNYSIGIDGSDDSFRISNASSVGTTDRLTIDSSGNVGIGVTDPDEQLELTGRVHLGQTTAPGTTTDKLYNVSGSLVWNGTTLGSGGGGDVSAGSTFTTSQIIMVCDGDDKTIDEPSGTISTNDQALTVGNNTGIRVGDGSELEMSVSVGNDIKFRGHGSNNDMIFALSDGGTETEIMRLDGADPAVEIKGGAVSSGLIRIYEDSDNGTDAVTLTVPASLSSGYTLTLPDGNGDSGDVLQSDGDGNLSFAAVSGTDRYTVTNRFRCGALSSTSTTYFTGDVATDAGQFYIASWSATHGSTIDVDADWLSGYEVGPQWQAPRACTLTQIAATSRINNSAATAVRVHVFKATPVNNTTSSDDLTWTVVGSADLDDGGGTPGVLTDYELQTVNDTISSGNAISAGDCVIIGLQPITGATSATSYFQITLEFTVS